MVLFLVIHFWIFFFIFLLYPSKIQERLLYSFRYTRPFSRGLVIHFCYTWIFIKIFVILRFVMQLFMHNQKKAIVYKVEQKCFLYSRDRPEQPPPGNSPPCLRAYFKYFRSARLEQPPPPLFQGHQIYFEQCETEPQPFHQRRFLLNREGKVI